MSAESMAVRSDVQSAVEAAVDSALERGEFGLGVTVYQNGECVADVRKGIADDETQRPVDQDTLFWLGSVTKAFVALCLHVQAERGLVDYAAPITTYWPGFGQHGKDRCTVLDALSHRSGIPIFPLDATPESMCDWGWVVGRLAAAHPIYEPGTANSYHSYTFGWIIGEIVQRTDPEGRMIGDFLREEILDPLGADQLWLGVPGDAEPRIARAHEKPVAAENKGDSYVGASPYPYERIMALPPAVAASQAVFGRSDVRQAGNPGAGAIGDSDAVARVFAMLAEGGELNGVRLLSPERVSLLYAPRPEQWDLVLGESTRMGIGGFWIANPTEAQMAPAGEGLQIIAHPGAGGNIAWADIGNRFAVAITANRHGTGRESPHGNPLTEIGDSIRRSLGTASSQQPWRKAGS